MKYDDASWHYGADGFPKDEPEEYGATPIGLFMKWCFIQGGNVFFMRLQEIMIV